MRLLINILFSLILSLTRPFRLFQPDICRSFIRLNNWLVKKKGLRVDKAKLLILLPHCLQRMDCEFKITHQIKNCRGCGKCPIKGLIEIAQQYQVTISVATGGGLARRLVKMHRPDGIIAVGCEQELMSGICDVYPLPVVAIENLRPQGPCQNTELNLEDVTEAIRSLLRQ